MNTPKSVISKQTWEKAWSNNQNLVMGWNESAFLFVFLLSKWELLFFSCLSCSKRGARNFHVTSCFLYVIKQWNFKTLQCEIFIVSIACPAEYSTSSKVLDSIFWRISWLLASSKNISLSNELILNWVSFYFRDCNFATTSCITFKLNFDNLQF